MHKPTDMPSAGWYIGLMRLVKERVQESVAHLDYHIDYQYSNLGVPHFSEHPLVKVE
jgi:hypothetical protein